MHPSPSRILARPFTPILAAAVFLTTTLLLPISSHSPSTAGRAMADLRDTVLGRARSTWCVFPYAQKWYTIDARGRVVPASNELVSTMPSGVPLVLVSADTFPSGPHGFWAPTRATWDMRITVDSAGLSMSPKFVGLRAQFVDELAASGDPVFQRDQATLRTADIHRRTTLWSGYLHNAASLASFLVFATSAPLAIRRTWRKLHTPPGHCPNCRYDLRATPPDAPCPECGRLR